MQLHSGEVRRVVGGREEGSDGGREEGSDGGIVSFPDPHVHPPEKRVWNFSSDFLVLLNASAYVKLCSYM